MRSNKSEPLVDEVELTNVNSPYAEVHYKSGREATASIHNFSPCPQTLRWENDRK